MKTLFLFIIGTLFGIWLYNSHPALIPSNLTTAVDASMDWIQSMWPHDESTAETKNNQRHQDTPEFDESITQEPLLNTTEPDTPQNTPTRDTTNSIELKAPRHEAMSTYSRVIQMIDQTP